MSTENAPQPHADDQNVPKIDPLKLQMYMQELRDNQNLGLGILGAGIAALLGASLWAGITIATSFQFGIMAIGAGCLVGFGVRYLGKGIDLVYGIFGAVFALISCVLGNHLINCHYLAEAANIGFWEAVQLVDFNLAVELMGETFHPMDVVFYALAVYCGYKYAIVKVSRSDLEKLVTT